jgi:hypothetical protein
MSGNGSPLVLAFVALLPACSSGLDFDGLSGDFGKGCTAGSGPNCEDVASGLSGLRVELPCLGAGMPDFTCQSDPKSEKTTTLRGTSGTKYNLQLRFRGIVEMNTYGQGVMSDFPFQVGGVSSTGAYNIYSLLVSDPMQTYFLNAVMSSTDRKTYSELVDKTEIVPARANATVILRGEANDGYTIKNIDSIGNPNPTPQGVDLLPSPFSGQFMQVDVLSVAVTP